MKTLSWQAKGFWPAAAAVANTRAAGKAGRGATAAPLRARDQGGDAPGQLAPARPVEGARAPHDPQARLVDPRDDVEVHVEHRLVRGRPVVLEDVVGGGPRRLHHRPAEAREH